MKHFLLLTLFSLFLNSCAENKPTTLNPSSDSLSASRNVPIDSAKCIECVRGPLKTDIDSLKMLVKTIHNNTLPPHMLKDFIQSKILEEIYNWVFHRSAANQILVFLVAIFGMFASLVMIVKLFYDDPAQLPLSNVPGIKRSRKRLLNFSGFILFFIVSAFLFVSTNRSHSAASTSKTAGKTLQFITGQDSTYLSDENIKHQLNHLSAQIDSTQKLIRTVDVEAAIKSNERLQSMYLILMISTAVWMIFFYIKSFWNRGRNIR